MFIKEIHIKKFGGITDKTIKFDDKFNIVYGENETGKTTIFKFIYSMLYGLEPQRGKVSKTDLYRRYEPWDNPVFFSGTMLFVTGKKTFRLERNFYKKDRRDSLICMDDGEELSIADGDLEVLLGGVDSQVFKNNNMVNEDGNTKDYGIILGNKDEKKAQVWDTVSKALADLKESKKKEEKRLKKLQENHRNVLVSYEIEQKHIQETIKNNEEYIENNDGVSQVQNLYLAGAALFAVATMFLWKLAGVVPGIVSLLLAIVSGAIGIYKLAGVRKEKVLVIKMAEANIKDAKLKLENIIDSMNDNTEYEKKIKECQFNIEAMDLAMKEIVETYKEYVDSERINLQNKASDFLARITDNRHNTVIMDKNNDIKLLVDDNYRSMDIFSKGTENQVDLVLKLSGAFNNAEREEMPLLLDNAMAEYDDSRMKRTIDILGEMNNQIILFTCHNREMEYMDGKGIKYNRIIL